MALLKLLIPIATKMFIYFLLFNRLCSVLTLNGGDEVHKYEDNMLLSAAPIVYNLQNGLRNGCTATFVNDDKHLITAAHCIGDQLLPGSSWLLDDEWMRVRFTIKKTFIHPKWAPKKPYDTHDLTHDLAVLQLESGFSYAKPLTVDYLRMKVHANVAVYGYGYTDQLFTPSEYLRKLKMNVTESKAFKVLETRSNRGNCCAGDSGGPVLSDENEFIGIVVKGTSDSYIPCDGIGTTQVVSFVWNMDWLVTVLPSPPNV